MNVEDFAVVSDLLRRTRLVVVRMRRLCELPPEGALVDVRHELREVETDLASFTEYIQKTRAIAWGAKPARHAPVPWVAKAPLRSTDVEPISRVPRFNMDGSPKP